jgi:hypothetical protein
VFYVDHANGALDFRSLPAPTDEEVAVVLARIVTRVAHVLRRHGFDPGDADMSQADPVVEESPVLAGISSASIQGRIALGPRVGARVWRVGADPEAPWLLSPAPRHTTLRGSICTPTSTRPPRIADGWSSSAVICSGRRSRRIGCIFSTMAASCSR